jgi:cytochrome c553
MKGMLSLIIVFTVIIAMGFSASGVQDTGGKEVFVKAKCGTCHSVESAGLTTKAKKSTDLSFAGDKFDQEFLIKFLTKKEKLNDKAHPAAFKGTDEELAKLTKWMSSLQKTK